ncbi:hypothetical protein Ahy_A03g012164 isoform A [Arachis hypogaea]|uniref:Uncharacterized protein n=1 Tax=Arachis hypogaea TaxID=3818 RepID=A0A445DSU4_ARAHY|nr:hypothetical protein Ahy_A03g012164 isoform A [Arachis hypogaea]
MSLLLPSKERSSLIRFIGFDLRVRCAVAHLLLTTSNAIIAVLGGASAIWYNLRSHIGGRRKGERERLLYRRVSKSGHYAIAYEIEQSTSSINVSPPPAAPKLSKLLLWSERSPLSTSVLSKEGRIAIQVGATTRTSQRLVIGDLYYPSNDLDPYIKDKNDDDDSEELEDRSLIQLISSLANVIGPSYHPLNMFPFSGSIISFISFIVSMHPINTRNFLAAGSMEPSIEIWDLDVVSEYDNQEWGNIFHVFKEISVTGNALERVLALEIELAEALQAKKKSSMQFQSRIVVILKLIQQSQRLVPDEIQLSQVLDFSLHPQELKSVPYNTIYHSIRQVSSIFYPKTRSSTELAGAEGGNFWPPNLIHHHLAKLLVLYIHILSSKNSTY